MTVFLLCSSSEAQELLLAVTGDAMEVACVMAKDASTGQRNSKMLTGLSKTIWKLVKTHTNSAHIFRGLTAYIAALPDDNPLKGKAKSIRREAQKKVIVFLYREEQYMPLRDELNDVLNAPLSALFANMDTDTRHLDELYALVEDNLWSSSHALRLHTLKALASFQQHMLLPPIRSTDV